MDKKILIYGIPDKRFYDYLKEKKIKEVFVSELRPNLEGAKLVSKELLKNKIKPILISDNMLGFCVSKNLVGEIVLFYDKIVSNKVICRTGSLVAVLLAKKHLVPISCWPAKKGIKKSVHKKTLTNFLGSTIAPHDIKTYSNLEEEIPLGCLNRVE
ncbi:MAG: hypothetical protein AB1472_05755 [Candidatus Omnitrophota bacterium]